MVQNHLLQVLSLMAMEPPVAFEADAVRDEKLKVLKALRHIPEGRDSNVRSCARSTPPARSPASAVPGYREEPGVTRASTTETFVALKLFIDSWRWAGVPFYLRSGKRLPKRVTEIAIHFKEAPHLLFGRRGDGIRPNVLSIRIQPDEGIALNFGSKLPGPAMEIAPVSMEFRYGSSFGVEPPEAYERLLLDCLLGDGTLFTRGDEVEASWSWMSRIHQRWAGRDRRRQDHPPRLRGRELGPRGGRSDAGRRRPRLASTVSNDQAQNPGRVPHLPPGTPPGEAQLRPREVEKARANFERFARGEPIAVDVGEIERELGALWQQASHDGGSAAVGRAALWNLVIPSHGNEALAKTKALVDAIAPVVPVRAIILCLDGAPGGADLSATIESHVISQPGGGRVVYSEEITLVGPAGAEAHFGAMVRALQVPGVRTATLWMDASMPSTLLVRELLPVTRRLVVDTGSCSGPPHLQDLQRLAARTQPRPVADLGWLRLGSFRLLFAGLFDPPVGGAPLGSATKLVVRHRTGGDVGALLIVAWLGQLLGWRPLRASETADGGLRFDLERADGGSVEAFVVPGPGACDESAILGDSSFRAAATSTSSPATRSTGRTSSSRSRRRKAVKLDAYSDADVCVAALGPRGRDPLFARCLEYAGRLWTLEAKSAGSRR